MLTHHWLSHTIIWFPDLRVCLFSTGSGEKAETRGEAEEAGSYRRPAERKECRRVGVRFYSYIDISVSHPALSNIHLSPLRLCLFKNDSIFNQVIKKKKEAITVDHRDEKFMNDYSVINYLHKSH